MADTTTQSGQIGSVISSNGSVWAVHGTSQRPLSEGAPVYEGEKIVTESGSNVEIQFSDDTILGQGENSATRLDEYVFSGEDSVLDFEMIQGALRVVSGEIVKINPENFNLQTPLATIGIRGTQVMVQIDGGREIIGVDELGEGHEVIVSNAFNQVIITEAGMFSGVDFDGSLIVPDQMPDHFMSTMTRAVPLTIIGDAPRNFDDPQGIQPPTFYETIGNQSGEERPGVGMEYAEEDDDDEEFAMDGEEDFDLSEEELEAMFDADIETAAGPNEGGTAEELGEVVELGHDPYDPTIEGAQGGSGPAGTQAGAAPPAQDDPPPTDDPEATPEQPVVEQVATQQDPSEENSPVEYNVIDDDGDSTLVEVVIEDPSSNGEVTFEPEGTITYIPEEGEEGTVDIDYTVESEDGATTLGQLTIELAPDSVPEISVTSTTGDESESLASASGAIDVDFGADTRGASITLASTVAEWDTESQTLIAEDSSWEISLTNTGYTFTQYEAFDHTDGDDYVIDVSLVATDGDNTVATGDFTVTVSDSGPTADDAYVLQEYHGETVSYNVFTEGDAVLGFDGGTLVDAWLDSGSSLTGDVSFDADGTVTYDPTYGESGTLTINYVVEDGDGDQASAQLDVELNPEHVEGGNFSQEDVTAPVGNSWVAAMDSSVDGWEAPGLYDASGEQSSNFPTGGTTSMIEVWKAGFKGVYDIDGQADGYFIEVDYAGATDSIFQTMTTESDNDYTLTFAATVRPDAPYGESLIVQIWDDTTMIAEETIVPDKYNTQTQEGWNEYTVNFTALSDETRVVFTEPDFGDPGNPKNTYGVLLDNISLLEGETPVITTTSASGDESDGLVIATGDLDIEYSGNGGSYTLSADGADWDSENKTLSDREGNWTLVVTQAGYVFTQLGALSHSNEADPNDILALDVTVTATAADGTVATDDFSISIGDDGPTANNADLTQDGVGDAVTYNVFTGESALTGIDGGTLTAAGLTPGSDYTGTVTSNPDGTITYTPTQGEIGTVTVDYTITDGDGDTASAHLAIELAEAAPEIQIDNLLGGNGGEVLIGGEGDDTLDGAQGRDVIFGTGGDDSLIGGNAKDALFAGTGNDVLDGGKGNDKLAGEAGADTLTGGQGNDTFIFTSPDDGQDTILDFNSARDHIQLYEATFDLGMDNQGDILDNQFATMNDDTFTGGYDFEGATSGLIYASETGSNTGALFYDPNDTVSGDETLLATITEEDGIDLSVDNIDIV